MSDKKETPPQKPHKDYHHQHQHEDDDDDKQQLYIHNTTPSSQSPSTFSPFDYEHPKRPRYTTLAPPQILQQWKPAQVAQQSPQPSPSHSNPNPNPQAQLITSPDTPSSSSAQAQAQTQEQQQQQQQHQFRKGKYVSPVWKPHEMLCLAKAWRAQYQGDGPGPGPGTETQAGAGRGKTRAEKDKEVADYLARNGVNRDAKTAGTKWDNMLGEFRKVYEWERGGEREEIGNKSYFRLSPYERKLHRLPASFDEQVFEELSQFMGPRIRPTGGTSSVTSSLYFQHQVYGYKALPLASSPAALPPPPLIGSSSFREDDFSLSSMISARTRQMEQHQSILRHQRNPFLLGHDLEFGSSPLSTPMTRGPNLRRIGRMRMTWEESVSLWAEEGEFHRGRVKVDGSNAFNGDNEIVYFDQNMVVSPLECFEDGPFGGFSVDTFVVGQQLKVFGRRKSTVSVPGQHGFSSGDFQDPTDYHLGCLRVIPQTLPTLIELSWYIQEPPPEQLRFPLRKDIYRDLPQGKDHFFTTSNDPLDSKSFTIDILSSLIRSTPIGSISTSRDSYIGLWDDCINRIVSKFCPIEIQFIRKPIHDEWPNLTGMVKNLCLWRGEEVDQVRENRGLNDPSSSIASKLLWTYDDIPYVLGYYAIGHNVTFCALSPSHKNEAEMTRTDLYSIDLSNPSERLKSLIICWRIGILLASLAEKCSKDCESDFSRQDFGDGNIIEVTPNSVSKYYSSKRKWQTVKEIYDMLDQRVPHMEHVVAHDEAESSLVFKPRGIKIRPKNCSQLVLALKQVAKALVALHDLSLMHRDLSWENIMFKSKSNDSSDEEEWFVRGFDEAVGAPQINPRGTIEECGAHAPEMARGVHGVKVDVWGIGYLVKTSGVVMTKSEESLVGKKLRELQERCMEQNSEVRPTAADCYHHLLQIQTSLSSADRSS